jgi:CyaY protein
MTESEFKRHLEDTLIAVEEAVDESGAEIDFETEGGVLTLRFPNRSKIIINGQPTLQQLWVAAKSGGFHFNYDDTEGVWKNETNQEELFYFLGHLCSEQAGHSISFT